MFVPELERTVDQLVDAGREVWVANPSNLAIHLEVCQVMPDTKGCFLGAHIEPSAIKSNRSLRRALDHGVLILIDPDSITAADRRSSGTLVTQSFRDIPAAIGNLTVKDAHGPQSARNEHSNQPFVDSLRTKQPEELVQLIVAHGRLSSKDIAAATKQGTPELWSLLAQNIDTYVQKTHAAAAAMLLQAAQASGPLLPADWDDSLKQAYADGRLPASSHTLSAVEAHAVLQSGG